MLEKNLLDMANDVKSLFWYMTSFAIFGFFSSVINKKIISYVGKIFNYI